MPNTFYIKIRGGNPGNGRLRTDDGGHTRATAGDKIIWEIETNPQVVAILDIQPKDGSDIIFSAGPTRVSDIKWEATTNPAISSACAVFNYSIRWRANTGATPTHDPIISIKPSIRFTDYIGIILSFLGGGLVSFILWRMDRIKYKKENERLELENKKLKNR